MNELHLRELCAELDIEVKFKNTKGWLVCPCPLAPWTHQFGSDRNPSFNLHVNPTGYSGFNCFTCNAAGNLTKLINTLGEYNEVDNGPLAIRTMIKETPESFGGFEEYEEVEEQLTSIEETVYLRMYPSAVDEVIAVEYLKDRGITRAAAIEMGLLYDPEDFRLMFPVYGEGGNLFGFTGRSVLPEDAWPTSSGRSYSKVKDYAGLRKDRLILGEQLIEEGKPILVVEGLMGFASLISRGVREIVNVVATMGSHMSGGQADIISSYGEAVYLLYDPDFAGEVGLWGAVEGHEHIGGGAVDMLKEEVVTFVCAYPEGIDDVDDLEFEDVAVMLTAEGSELQ